MLESYAKEITPKLVDMGINAAQTSLRIALIVIAAYIGIKVLRIALDNLERLLTRAAELTERVPGAGSQRIKTLIGVLRTVVVMLVWFVVVVTSLSHIGIAAMNERMPSGA